ncbi:MAG: hypothetical protein QM765_24180 [Myxococcales bacterium]
MVTGEPSSATRKRSSLCRSASLVRTRSVTSSTRESTEKVPDAFRKVALCHSQCRTRPSLWRFRLRLTVREPAPATIPFITSSTRGLSSGWIHSHSSIRFPRTSAAVQPKVAVAAFDQRTIRYSDVSHSMAATGEFSSSDSTRSLSARSASLQRTRSVTSWTWDKTVGTPRASRKTEAYQSQWITTPSLRTLRHLAVFGSRSSPAKTCAATRPSGGRSSGKMQPSSSSRWPTASIAVQPKTRVASFDHRWMRRSSADHSSVASGERSSSASSRSAAARCSSRARAFADGTRFPCRLPPALPGLRVFGCIAPPRERGWMGLRVRRRIIRSADVARATPEAFVAETVACPT